MSLTLDDGIRIVMDEAAKHSVAVTEKHAGYLLWNHTGWPGFFDTDDHEDCIRKSIHVWAGDSSL